MALDIRRQGEIERGHGKRALPHARTRRQCPQWLRSLRSEAVCERVLPASHDGGVASSPACAERFTEMMPVTTPKVFHGCATLDGVQTHTQAARRRSASMRCMQRGCLAALPPWNRDNVQFGDHGRRGDHVEKIRSLCGRSIRPLSCCCSVVSGVVVGVEISRRLAATPWNCATRAEAVSAVSACLFGITGPMALTNRRLT